MKYNPFELLYRAAFAGALFYRKHTGGYHFSGPVISVGNISIGGTGKSVLVSFLIKKIKRYRGAIVTRGYKREIKNGKKNQIVSYGQGLLVPCEQAGDEASMFARTLPVPVVVGANRAMSAQLLERDSRTKDRIDYLVLDDAYQNFALQKDFEILLIDARQSLAGARCLPLGRFREHDISRADVVIVTHADEVSAAQLTECTNFLSQTIPLERVFAGKHAIAGVSWVGGKGRRALCSEDSVIAVAGIGSFGGFLQSIDRLQVSVKGSVQYKDHHAYTVKDIRHIINMAANNGAQHILTTEKDWQKIEPLLQKITVENVSFHVLEIKFEFLYEQEEHSFWRCLYNAFCWEFS